MVKRESRGQKVKAFTVHEPQEDMSYQPNVVQVYFKDDEFVAYLPEHMVKVVENLPLFKDGYQTQSQYLRVRLSYDGQCIYAKIVDHLVEGYKQIQLQYFQHLTDLAARKVIRIGFQANLPFDRGYFDRGGKQVSPSGGGSAVVRNDISFAGYPTVHLSYRVLWRAGDTLYQRFEPVHEGDRPRMQYIDNPFLRVSNRTTREAIEATLLEWTQEKEDFLADTVRKLTELGMRMHEFFHNPEANIQYSLASGGGQLAIAPPAKEDAS